MMNKTRTIPAQSGLIIPIQVNIQDSIEQQNVLIQAQELSEDILCGYVMNIVKDFMFIPQIKFK